MNTKKILTYTYRYTQNCKHSATLLHTADLQCQEQTVMMPVVR